jgi:hypothetical protein
VPILLSGCTKYARNVVTSPVATEYACDQAEEQSALPLTSHTVTAEADNTMEYKYPMMRPFMMRGLMLADCLRVVAIVTVTL